MIRMARFLKEGGCYLIQSHSYRNQKIFKMNSDFEQYIKLLKKYKARFQVNVYGYCLTPMAAYLIIQPRDSYALPSFMQGINQSYALFYNKRYNGVGKVWGQRYKSTLINGDQDLFEHIKSVEFIPVKENRAQSPVEYLWSSYTERILGSQSIVDRKEPMGEHSTQV